MVVNEIVGSSCQASPNFLLQVVSLCTPAHMCILVSPACVCIPVSPADTPANGAQGMRKSIHYLMGNHTWVVSQIAQVQNSLLAAREAFDQKDVDLVGVRQRLSALEGSSLSLTGTVKKHHYNITQLKVSPGLSLPLSLSLPPSLSPVPLSRIFVSVSLPISFSLPRCSKLSRWVGPIIFSSTAYLPFHYNFLRMIANNDTLGFFLLLYNLSGFLGELGDSWVGWLPAWFTPFMFLCYLISVCVCVFEFQFTLFQVHSTVPSSRHLGVGGCPQLKIPCNSEFSTPMHTNACITAYWYWVSLYAENGVIDCTLEGIFMQRCVENLSFVRAAYKCMCVHVYHGKNWRRVSGWGRCPVEGGARLREVPG